MCASPTTFVVRLPVALTPAALIVSANGQRLVNAHRWSDAKAKPQLAHTRWRARERLVCEEMVLNREHQ